MNHRTARGHAPFIAARNDADPYTRMVLYRSRSPSPNRGENELILRGQAAKKGKNTAIAVSIMSIQYALQRRSLDKKMAVLGADSSELDDFMSNLALIWYQQGLYRETERLEVQIVDFRRGTLGANHVKTLEAMVQLGRTRLQEGRYTNYEALYTNNEALQFQIFDTRKGALGERHESTLAALLELASTWWSQGRYNEAESAQNQVIQIGKESLGPKHMLTINAISNLALTLSGQGRLEEAEAAQIRALESRREALGSKHRRTIAAMGNLASTWHMQGRYEEAEELKSGSLELRKEVLGPDHPATFVYMHSLAVTWHELERFPEAETLMSEAVDLRAKVLGRSHPYTTSSMNTLARWQAQRPEREAQAYEDETLELSHHVTDGLLLIPTVDKGKDPAMTRHTPNQQHVVELPRDETHDLEDESSTRSYRWSNTILLPVSNALRGGDRVQKIFEEEEEEEQDEQTRCPEQEWQSGIIADSTAERAPEGHEAEAKAKDEDVMEDLEPLQDLNHKDRGRSRKPILKVTTAIDDAKAQLDFDDHQAEKDTPEPVQIAESLQLTLKATTAVPEEAQPLTHSRQDEVDSSKMAQTPATLQPTQPTLRRQRRHITQHPILKTCTPSIHPRCAVLPPPCARNRHLVTKPKRLRHSLRRRPLRTPINNPRQTPPSPNMLHLVALLFSISLLCITLSLILASFIFLLPPLTSAVLGHFPSWAVLSSLEQS